MAIEVDRLLQLDVVRREREAAAIEGRASLSAIHIRLQLGLRALSAVLPSSQKIGALDVGVGIDRGDVFRRAIHIARCRHDIRALSTNPSRKPA